MKQIKQYRYYGNNNSNTYPKDLSDSQLTFGNIFDGIAVSQLGIQGRPNTGFYLNDSIYPIILGETGIYEIDLQDRGVITSISFINDETFKKYSAGDRLLIDVVFEQKGGN